VISDQVIRCNNFSGGAWLPGALKYKCLSFEFGSNMGSEADEIILFSFKQIQW
jgi:hypothetical protein